MTSPFPVAQLRAQLLARCLALAWLALARRDTHGAHYYCGRAEYVRDLPHRYVAAVAPVIAEMLGAFEAAEGVRRG